MKYFLIILLRFYQNFLSPLKRQTCRFYPSCSNYALEALQKYNFAKACLLILKRILRCHPWHPGGYDPLK